VIGLSHPDETHRTDTTDSDILAKIACDTEYITYDAQSGRELFMNVSGRVAPADGPKSARKVSVLRIDFFGAWKRPPITASTMANAPAAWDTQTNTQYHTPDANMTSLSIRLTVPLREVISRDTLAQRTATARASREHHVHSTSPCAQEACCSP